MKKNGLFMLICLLAQTFLAACGPSQAELDATETQMADNIMATQTAKVPTATNTPTPSPTPTNTLTPTNTPTSSPTPSPTATPTPTLIPTPIIPMALYESAQYPFQIQIPAEWDESPQQEGVTVGYAEEGGALFIAEEDLKALGLGGMTVGEYSDLVFTLVESTYPDYELLSHQEIVNKQGLPIVIIEAILNPGESTQWKFHRLIYLHEGSIAFNATYVTLNTEYYKNLVEYSFSTFQITE